MITENRRADRRQRLLAGLAADQYGHADERPPLVLLHGLTFDRSTWRPVVAELQRIDPDRQMLVLDLPGHGQSPAWPSYDIQVLREGVHRAIEEADLRSPVVVGHSISGVIATAYAGEFPTSGVVSVDQSLEVGPFTELVHSLADKLRGPAFPEVWEMFARSMHAELLPDTARELVESTTRPRQDLVTGYWREVMDRPAGELAAEVTSTLARLRAVGTPYLVVTGQDVEPRYRSWLAEVLPQATVTVLPGSGHFPHLAHPDRFAECLAGTGHWQKVSTEATLSI